MGDITTIDGYLWDDRGDEWQAAAYDLAPPSTPCLVVTGDLDTAKRRLAPPDDAKQAAVAVIASTLHVSSRHSPDANAVQVAAALAAAGLLVGTRKAPDDDAIERAAKAIYEETHLIWRISTPWEKRPEETRQAYRRSARAALAAAEETPKRWRGTSISELHDLYRRESRDAAEETPDA